MRRKEERSKQGQTNKQGKATQHTQGSHFTCNIQCHNNYVLYTASKCNFILSLTIISSVIKCDIGKFTDSSVHSRKIARVDSKVIQQIDEKKLLIPGSKINLLRSVGQGEWTKLCYYINVLCLILTKIIHDYSVGT